ncbi:hypothetical protein AOQ84DRAFT_384947 [Glonium stellatum]|uniref:DH domain-containing protein n=1 Tax=Glonium stellatum TaxID=574774 RepID=A0A8E2FBY0_9PEZI|nr:hypothetical protein AOQ84DRAFT_384947 [Glonium stellatum]
MVTINPPPPALSPDHLSLFYTTDELLSNSPVLVFYGPSATTTVATHSRIQAHVFSPAGLTSFPRLTISPNASFYDAVNCLPREEQGDEICRGLAFSLYKYFAELPLGVRNTWDRQLNSLGKLPSAPRLFTESHAAILASRMVRVENVEEIIQDVKQSLAEQTLSWLDLDVVLPPGSIRKLDNPRESTQFDESEEDLLDQRYGQYAPVVELFGETAFLPTSKLRRAPSKPTAVNRTQSFSRKQKENIRREMCELLDTEESYVSKIYDLIHSVAADFRQKAKTKSNGSSSPSEQALKGLFPPSLDQILMVNAGFMETIRVILEETENDAINDIESSTDETYIPPQRGQNDLPDVTGALALAKSLVEWFPKFGDCYTDYIQAHAEFSQFLKIFMKETGSSFSKRVHETGEQRLMSMLIEPVQRLPRYNLYIDNIVKQLPFRHPALKPFLKARDIISEICSRDSPSAQQVKMVDRLRKLVYSWPLVFQPTGRLITAIDVAELSPPYHIEPHAPGSTSGILLLFTSHIVVLHRPAGSSVSARSILADLDNPKVAETSVGPSEIVFYQQSQLSDVFLSEHSGGKIIQLISSNISSSHAGRPRSNDRLSNNIGFRMFYLTGSYEGKASRLVEEVAKARVEGRFSEAERESNAWEARCVSGDLSLFSAIFEDMEGRQVEGRREPAMIRVVIDPSSGSREISVGQESVEASVAISKLDEKFYLLEITGSNDYGTRDHLMATEFLPVLTKRLSNFLQMRNNIKNPALAMAFLLRNLHILKSLKFQVEGGEEESPQERAFRPQSPVKMLSNLFGGSVVKESGSSRKMHRSQQPSLGEIPRMMPTPARAHSRDGELSRPTSSGRTVGFNAADMMRDPLFKLEETLATYILALHARKGNIVGRSIHARAGADELVVNELYNSLLEDPNNHQAAAQAPVDILFAAFEKFLKVAWKQKMGPVISQSTLNSMQSKSDSLYPGEFEEFFRLTYNDMAPQNQRSLQATIKLLGDLLDGTSNDGDRGILTAAFAEILVPEGNPIDFISLLDRFIEDADSLFGGQVSSGLATPNYGSMNSDTRTRATNTGSLSSNTSSLRKRFGFGTLSRENSKSEHESKVGSLWRTLSKTSHGGESQPPSLSKAASLGRSNSTDANIRISPKRPVSRDRPTVLGAFSFENGEGYSGRPFIGAGLGTIGEVPASGPPRKKRRSSLSDLKTLQASANNTPTWSPQTPRRLDSAQRGTRQSSASPRTPSPTKPTHIPTPTRLGSPMRKENSPANALDRHPFNRPTLKATPAAAKSDEVTITSHSPSKRRTDSISGIPTLRSTPSSSGGLSERPTSGNATKIPPVPVSPTKSSAAVSPPKKLRMQSPQKLRERLQNEQKAINSASKELQAELSAIGSELAALSSTKPPRLTTTTSAPPTTASPTKLEARLAALENSTRTTLETINARTSSISSDLTSSLQVSESRVKKLDELYREANAENEALYGKFNEELAKVLRGVKKGQGEEEMQKRMKEQQEELSRLRKENGRLKREVVGLRAQLKGE